MIRVGIALLLLAGTATARPSPEWNDSPQVIHEWFQKLMRPDMPYMSCCAEADAFEADDFQVRGDKVLVTVTAGRANVQAGAQFEVPAEKFKWDNGNPTGHGWLFLGGGSQVYCYVTPGGV